MKNDRPPSLLPKVQQVGHQSIDTTDFQTELDLDLDALPRVCATREHFPKTTTLLHGMTDVEEQTILQESKYPEQRTLARAVGPDDHTQTGHVDNTGIPKALVVLQTDGFDTHGLSPKESSLTSLVLSDRSLFHERRPFPFHDHGGIALHQP